MTDYMPESNKVTKSELQELGKLRLDIKKVTRGYSVYSAEQAGIFYRRTPTKWKQQRPGKGGETWTYVRKGYVRSQLNILFSFDYDFDSATSTLEALEVAAKTGAVVVKGTITGRVHDKEGLVVATIKRTDYGTAPIKWQMENVYDVNGQPMYETDRYGKKKAIRKRKVDDITGAPLPLDFGNDLKAATTDCIKRCAAQLGIASDIYDVDEFMPIDIVDERDGKTAQQGNVAQLIEEAKTQNIALEQGESV